MKNQQMKFEDARLHDTEDVGRFTNCEGQTDAGSDKQAERNMPTQLFQSWGHKNSRFMDIGSTLHAGKFFMLLLSSAEFFQN